ncbi:MAG: hypothetical protein SCALA702_16440 [Melioribacteraceae bacterium]|nr:MAG: hypothetical protein SCALA702_16440 [Melioribacteraceae bacterium]
MVYAEAELFFVPDFVEIGRDKFSFNNVEFRSGKIINSHLNGANHFCFFFATIGQSVSEKIKYYHRISDSLNAYLLHKLAGDVVELLVDYLQYNVFKSVEPAMIAGNRVSPGYCGWDVSEQQKFFGLFPGRKIKIELTESSLMVPDKSVTGLWGYGKNFRKLDYNCTNCEAELCYKKFRS